MHRPDFERTSAAQGDVVRVNRLAVDMLVPAFVGQRTVRRHHGFRQRCHVFLPHRLAMKFLEQTDDESRAVVCAATRVADRFEFLAQHRTGSLNGFIVPDLADEKTFRLQRAGRRGCHAAKSESRFGHDVLFVRLDIEGSRHRADVHLAPLGNFEPFALAC